jgi:hypothetical protein
MSERSPKIQDVWRSLQDMGSLLGTMNKRFDGFERRLDGVERQMVSLREDLAGRMAAGFASLKESIEARDFRLDEHGRRLSELERSRT